MFIDLLVGQIDLGAVGDNQRELHLFRSRALALQEHALNAGQHEFAHRASIGGRLRFEPTIQRRRDIDGGANRIRLHEWYYFTGAINMEAFLLT